MVYGFQLEYTLSPQSPLIHFQYDTDGATLRATEVKPKLDRFLLRRAKAEGIDCGEWVNKKHETALDYKLEIRPADDKNPNRIKLGRNTNYEIYYGNMSSDENAREIFAIRKAAILTVTCLNPKLRKFIDDNIDEFFVVTNFGRMSSKGFGSYLLTKKKLCSNGEETEQKRSQYSTNDIADILKKEYGAKVCCCFNGGKNDTAFRRIKIIYSLMKSGLNFHGYQRSLLFLYAHEKLGFDNEKAYLKQQKVAPAVIDKRKRCHKIGDIKTYYHMPSHGKGKERYIRALLGVGDHINFKNNPANKHSTFTKVSIKGRKETPDHEINETIDRFPSPILFKIIEETVYYIARPIDEKIYKSEFTFSNESSEDIHRLCECKSVTISVPAESEVTPEDPELSFLDDFLRYSKNKMNDRSEYEETRGKRVLDIFEDTVGVVIQEV